MEDQVANQPLAGYASGCKRGKSPVHSGPQGLVVHLD